MSGKYFVEKHSIVREIWGKGDTILVIFAGAAAEFALNKAVDWLYFTGRLPADPLGRLFSTVAYAREIVFSDKESAFRAIDRITAIHQSMENQRGTEIPDWAYRDVLFMLIDYSIRAFEIMEHKLQPDEKDEVFAVFNQVGQRMGLTGLPRDFGEWERMRVEHLQRNMQHSLYTADLFRQYRKHLGSLRYRLLLETQILVVPQKVRNLLGYRKRSFLSPLIGIYKLGRSVKLDGLVKVIILPSKYKKEIMDLDIAT